MHFFTGIACQISYEVRVSFYDRLSRLYKLVRVITVVLRLIKKRSQNLSDEFVFVSHCVGDVPALVCGLDGVRGVKLAHLLLLLAKFNLKT